MAHLWTTGALKVLSQAHRAAKEFRHDYIGPEHILLGLVENTGGAVEILKELKVDPELIREGVERLIPGSRMPTPKSSPTPDKLAAARERYERHGGDFDALVREIAAKAFQRMKSAVGESIPYTPDYTPDAKTVLEKAREEASALGHSHIGTAHLLLGLLRGGDAIAARVLREEHIRLAEVRKIVRALSQPENGQEGQ